MGKDVEKKIDRALDMTFPASDPPLFGDATGTEKPARPVGRRAPVVRKDDVEAAAGRNADTAARRRHRGVGREGLSPTDHVERSDNEQGLGGVGADSRHRRRKS
jgi:hypothetical protein